MSEPKLEVKWDRDATIGLLAVLAIVGGIIYMVGRPWTCGEAEAIYTDLERKRAQWFKDGDTKSLMLSTEQTEKNALNMAKKCQEK